ncbi:BTB/POZ domain-containing protein [Canna indica]|uniref:BTB/POZ domain-containing protein n=1 Tax=Canna indica TaxID=4628 RepID=A0AAQ3L1X6_9LILI|nr:BTB/POZ domain-containing protein [Canna indica]
MIMGIRYKEVISKDKQTALETFLSVVHDLIFRLLNGASGSFPFHVRSSWGIGVGGGGLALCQLPFSSASGAFRDAPNRVLVDQLAEAMAFVLKCLWASGLPALVGFGSDAIVGASQPLGSSGSARPSPTLSRVDPSAKADLARRGVHISDPEEQMLLPPRCVLTYSRRARRRAGVLVRRSSRLLSSRVSEASCLQRAVVRKAILNGDSPFAPSVGFSWCSSSSGFDSIAQEVCDLKVHINGQHTFLLHQKILCSFSGKLRKMMKQERRRSQAKSSGLKIMEFPGGPHGFELVSRFCYNNGSIAIVPSNICLLHCAAILLEMTEEVASFNLLSQTESSLEGLFQWTWRDTITALKSCELLLPAADASGLLQRLISSLLEKILSNSEIPFLSAASSFSSSSSSPDTSGFRGSPCATREWWFDDLTVFAPITVERIMKTLGAYGSDNKNLILTRFLLHYLKNSTVAVQRPWSCSREQYSGLADTAVHGVVAMGRAAFSCRGLFWVMRVVAGLGPSRECRQRLERVVGMMLDQATLDDLLVSGSGGAAYDVNLVVRLARTFVGSDEGGSCSLQRLKKVGRLIDKYLGEISPDPSLKISKFLEVAESLPDSARDCFDGVYRALDIYLESHPTLSTEERTRLCGCLNYEKLTLEACKDLAKNKRIPPGVAVQALVSQQSKLQIGGGGAAADAEVVDEKEELRHSLQRMQCRVRELEKVCRNMKGQMSRMEKSKSLGHGGRGMPRLC